MGYEHVTAEWARKTSESVLSDKIKKQLDDVLGKIDEAVKANKSYVNVFTSLEDLTQRELAKRGFNIEYYNAGYCDPRDLPYYVIRW